MSSTDCDVIASITRGLSVRSYRLAKGPLPVGTTIQGRLSDAILLVPPLSFGEDTTTFPDSGVFTGPLDVCTGGFVLHSSEIGPLPVAVSLNIASFTIMDGGDVLSTALSDNTPNEHWLLSADLSTALSQLNL